MTDCTVCLDFKTMYGLTKADKRPEKQAVKMLFMLQEIQEHREHKAGSPTPPDARHMEELDP